MTPDTAIQLAVGVAAAVGLVAAWHHDHHQQPLHRFDIDALFLTPAEREHFRERKTISRLEYVRLLKRSLDDINAELARRGLDPLDPHKKRL